MHALLHALSLLIVRIFATLLKLLHAHIDNLERIVTSMALQYVVDCLLGINTQKLGQVRVELEVDLALC